MVRIYDKTTIEKYVTKRMLFTLMVLLCSFLILTLLKQSVAVSEWITRHISRNIIKIFAFTSDVPISIFEALVLSAIIFAISIVIRIISYIKKRAWTTLFLHVTTVLVIVLAFVNFYTLTAGFAYNRKPLDLPKSETVYKEQTLEIAEYFVNDLAALSKTIKRENGKLVLPYSKSELNNKLKDEFKRLDSGYFSSFTPNAKPILNSWFMQSTGITGIAFLPTAEANVNTRIPVAWLAQTMAHELAHTKGVMRENDAELVSFYLLLTSEDDFLRYSGYLSIYHEFATIAYLGNNLDDELFERIANSIPEAVYADVSYAWEQWLQSGISGGKIVDWIKNKMNAVGDFFNDLYLKLNGENDGTGSYSKDFDYDFTITNPDDSSTERPIVEPSYSVFQKMLFAIYESNSP